MTFDLQRFEPQAAVVVIDFVVSADSMVWPMVPQGVSNSYVQYARDHAPTWDTDE